MEKSIRVLCVFSVFCALVLDLTPEGKEKRVMRFVCSIVLLSAVLRCFHAPDWELYALEAAQLREREQRFLQNSGEMEQQLQRSVIEEAYGAYIRNKASQMNIELEDASVTAQWSLEGLWVPDSVLLRGRAQERERELLSAILETELGIPRDRQRWIGDGA